MQAKNQYYGFDISLIEAVCKALDRPCQYRVMRFDELIPAVVNQEVDVAVSSITITIARAKQVSFSMPYYQSYARFLGRKSNSVEPFSFSQLNDKSIGVEQGSVLMDQAEELNIKNAKIVTFDDTHEGIEQLTEGGLDYLLLDNPSANFWAVQSSGILQMVGNPIQYGEGYAIAVNLNDSGLLASINGVLSRYMKSSLYKSNVLKYFGGLDNSPLL